MDPEQSEKISKMYENFFWENRKDLKMENA